MLDQPATGLHQPLLQARQRPVANPLRQHQPPLARIATSAMCLSRRAVDAPPDGESWMVAAHVTATKTGEPGGRRRGNSPVAALWTISLYSQVQLFSDLVVLLRELYAYVLPACLRGGQSGGPRSIEAI